MFTHCTPTLVFKYGYDVLSKHWLRMQRPSDSMLFCGSNRYQLHCGDFSHFIRAAQKGRIPPSGNWYWFPQMAPIKSYVGLSPKSGRILANSHGHLSDHLVHQKAFWKTRTGFLQQLHHLSAFLRKYLLWSFGKWIHPVYNPAYKLNRLVSSLVQVQRQTHTHAVRLNSPPSWVHAHRLLRTMDLNTLL